MRLRDTAEHGDVWVLCNSLATEGGDWRWYSGPHWGLTLGVHCLLRRLSAGPRMWKSAGCTGRICVQISHLRSACMSRPQQTWLQLCATFNPWHRSIHGTLDPCTLNPCTLNPCTRSVQGTRSTHGTRSMIHFSPWYTFDETRWCTFDNTRQCMVHVLITSGFSGCARPHPRLLHKTRGCPASATPSSCCGFPGRCL